MAGAFCAARSTKRDSHARWLHCLVRLRIPFYSNGFRNRWIGFGLGLHGLDGFLFVLLRQTGNSTALGQINYFVGSILIHSRLWFFIYFRVLDKIFVNAKNKLGQQTRNRIQPDILSACRVYEYRSYESPTEDMHLRKVHMFNEGGEVTLFANLNFNAIFYSKVIAGSRMPNLIYMTSFNNMEDRNAHWKSFVDAPLWKKISAAPEYLNSVNRNETVLMNARDYADF